MLKLGKKHMWKIPNAMGRQNKEICRYSVEKSWQRRMDKIGRGLYSDTVRVEERLDNDDKIDAAIVLQNLILVSVHILFLSVLLMVLYTVRY